MKTTYLEYSKYILEKVSFDKSLFEKELLKAIENLADTEVLELYQWCLDLYSSDYYTIISHCFNI
ncbi:hypothetical protein Q0590_16255 [Rhodocytophaga aerolata]|uniref:Uncharacterized protein n=1 Tax=Rhodocytophaga aerolata TaxID=455078 RepID=A0ABT8R6U4_9BACT|nr:hypothetical protein [Rhodocytophaga aerolata]MDO1447825.1 hypothetical protein [Rhodocytophaga aerolata]